MDSFLYYLLDSRNQQNSEKDQSPIQMTLISPVKFQARDDMFLFSVAANFAQAVIA